MLHCALHCVQYYFELSLDGRVVARVENTSPLQYAGVNVWAAQAQQGYPPTDAYIRNLQYS